MGARAAWLWGVGHAGCSDSRPDFHERQHSHWDVVWSMTSPEGPRPSGPGQAGGEPSGVPRAARLAGLAAPCSCPATSLGRCLDSSLGQALLPSVSGPHERPAVLVRTTGDSRGGWGPGGRTGLG